MDRKTKTFWLLLVTMLFLNFLLMGSVARAASADPIILELQIPIGDEGDRIEKMDIGPNSIGTYIKVVYKYGVALGTILGIVMIMIGGVIWLTSGGSPDRVKNAQSFIGGAFAGIILLLGSYLLLQTINPKLLDLTLPEITPIVGKPTKEDFNCGSGREQVEMEKCQTNGPASDIPEGCVLKSHSKGRDVYEQMCCCPAEDGIERDENNCRKGTEKIEISNSECVAYCEKKGAGVKWYEYEKFGEYMCCACGQRPQSWFDDPPKGGCYEFSKYFKYTASGSKTGSFCLAYCKNYINPVTNKNYIGASPYTTQNNQDGWCCVCTK